jgi:hypothetical protein
MRFAVAVTLVLLVGCRSSIETPPLIELEHGGTRLQGRFLVAEGGAKQFRGLHDSSLSVDCSPQLATDGQLRCLPTTATVLFADETCTKPVIEASPCGVPAYATFHDASSCDTTVVYAAGAKLGMTATFLKRVDGACIPLDASKDVVDAKPVDPAIFAAFTETRQRLGGIVVRVATSADGASIVRGTEIAANSEPCVAESVAIPFDIAPPLHCAPHAAWSVGDFSDGACRTPAAHWYGDPACTPPPKTAVAQISEADGCQLRFEYFSLAGELSESFTNVTGTCTKAAPDISVHRHALGEKLSPTFPAVERLDSGSGPLKLVQLAASGTAFTNAGFVDGSTRCSAHDFADGVLRCVPFDTRTLLAPTLFSDAACTRPLLEIAKNPCSDALPQFAISYESKGCSAPATKVHRLGARFTGSQQWQSSGADPSVCVPTSKLVEAVEIVGEVSPDDAFHRLTPTLE